MKVDIFNTDKKYQIIYADPPWTYRVWSGKGKTAANHYSCMKKEEIFELPVSEIADDNCILFLWVTFPCLKEGLQTIEKWGFCYKTCGFTWIKKNRKSEGLFWGLGYWTRANAEICIIATKGKPKRESKSVHQVIFSRIEEHSKKPDETRDRIVKLCGDVPRIELFARQSAEGWDCWGLEAPDDKKNV